MIQRSASAQPRRSFIVAGSGIFKMPRIGREADRDKTENWAGARWMAWMTSAWSPIGQNRSWSRQQGKVATDSGMLAPEIVASTLLMLRRDNSPALARACAKMWQNSV
jgi:hypothetical protein